MRGREIFEIELVFWLDMSFERKKKFSQNVPWKLEENLRKRYIGIFEFLFRTRFLKFEEEKRRNVLGIIFLNSREKDIERRRRKIFKI